jgi:hypothetical protein
MERWFSRMKKKLVLWLVCLMVALALSGCATVNEDNSFQSKAPGEVSETGKQQPTDAEPSAQTAEATAVPLATEPLATDAPTATPMAPGYNG